MGCQECLHKANGCCDNACDIGAYIKRPQRKRRCWFWIVVVTALAIDGSYIAYQANKYTVSHEVSFNASEDILTLYALLWQHASSTLFMSDLSKDGGGFPVFAFQLEFERASPEESYPFAAKYTRCHCQNALRLRVPSLLPLLTRQPCSSS